MSENIPSRPALAPGWSVASNESPGMTETVDERRLRPGALGQRRQECGQNRASQNVTDW